ncbi:hypothetical protein HDV05_000167 [Chytridiales sp. JEL 0842]|nr:hypothetical protein HDV05_000167 [Chytridiales sp. JEL 0842]
MAGRVRHEGMMEELREAKPGDVSKWTATVTLPRSNTSTEAFNIVVYLEFAWFVGGVLQDFRSREEGFEFFENASSSADMPSMKPLREPLIYGGRQTIKTEALTQIIPCDKDPTAFNVREIHGYWNLSTANPPHFRSICGTSIFHPQKKIDIKPLRGKWVMFIGDSNTRMMFRSFHRTLLGPVHTLSPYTGNLTIKNEYDFAGYLNQGALLSYFFFFPGDGKTGLRELQFNASTYFWNSSHITPAALAEVSPELKRKIEPDYVVLSVGSHSPSDPRGAVRATEQLLKSAGFIPPDRSKGLGKGCFDSRFLLVNTIATDSYMLSTKSTLDTEIRRLAYLQNNPRISILNQEIERTFGGCTIVDGYGLTLPLAVEGLFNDPAHPKPFVHQTLSSIIMAKVLEKAEMRETKT